MIENPEYNQVEKSTQKTIIIALRLAFIAVLLIMSYLILKPFIAPVLWGIIIAVALFPLHKRLSKSLGTRDKLSATIIVFIGISLLVIPSWMFTSSTIDSAILIGEHMNNGSLKVPPPDKAVAEWPLIGKSIYEIWFQASKSLTGLLEMFSEEIKSFAPSIINFATGLMGTVLLFIISLVISGALLVNTKSAEKASILIFKTLAGKEGEQFSALASATIRSVVQGVLGTALIQTLFLSIGLFLIGFPAAGLVSILILFVAIIQLPVMLIMLPAIIYVFSFADTTAAILFMIWSIIWSLSDNIIKPMIMGRGMEIPMLVILLGAIGGMILGGIIGLFIGAVLLAFTYKTFQAIIKESDQIKE